VQDKQQRKVLKVMDNELYILGAGGHAKVIIEIAELLEYKIAGVFDQNENIKNILNYPVSQDFQILLKQQNIFFAFGNNQSRKKNSESFRSNCFNLIHPSTVISKNIDLGCGNAIMAGVVINSSVKIGDFCIINTSASIDHDCEIGNYAHVSPKVALAGNVKVKEGAQIGIGACVKQNITIGKWAIVGAGAVVINDVPDYAVVVGNPSRIIKYLY
jgi:sugar O-acyltransferase (sialic acid O-acetyltransferase NeuD family)